MTDEHAEIDPIAWAKVRTYRAAFREKLLSGVSPLVLPVHSPLQNARVLQRVGLEAGWLVAKRVGAKYHIVEATA